MEGLQTPLPRSLSVALATILLLLTSAAGVLGGATEGGDYASDADGSVPRAPALEQAQTDAGDRAPTKIERWAPHGQETQDEPAYAPEEGSAPAPVHEDPASWLETGDAAPATRSHLVGGSSCEVSGPDPAGYTCELASFDFRNIAGTGTLLQLGDDELSNPIPLGFTFPFYGQNLTEVQISSNGFLTFADMAFSGCCSGESHPDPSHPNNLIAGYWTDLDPFAGGAVHYQTVGQAPNRTFIVQFTAVPQYHFPAPTPTTFQFQLMENGTVEVHYLEAVNNLITASAGVESSSGFFGVRYASGPLENQVETAVRYNSTTPRTVPLADLTVTNISFTPSNPNGLTPVEVTATVENHGDDLVHRGRTHVSVGGPEGVELNLSTPHLAPGEAANLTGTLGPLAEGNYTVSVTVDPQDEVRESNDTNNSLERDLTVEPLPAPQELPFEDDFDDGTLEASDWPATRNAQADDQCGTSSDPFALTFGGEGSRFAVAAPLNTSGGANVSFDLKIGQRDICENAEGEGVELQYSTDAGDTWTTIASYDAEAFGTFTRVTEPIPSDAATSATLFRWVQPDHSGNGFDNWAIDDVNVSEGSSGPETGDDVPGPSDAGEVLAGSFESGDLTGWGVFNAGSGDWLAYSGDRSPLSGQEISEPPVGQYAATTDQTGPGSHIMAQDIKVPESGEQNLSFVLYYDNDAGEFHTPNTLSHEDGPNQQYRVDLVDPNASVDSVASGDVLQNLFITREGDPPRMDPTLMAFDLSQYAGQTVRLRFAEVANQFFFRASVDLVQFGVPEFADPAVQGLDVHKSHLRTDYTDPLVNPAGSIDVSIDLSNTQAVPMKGEASVAAVACPKEGAVFDPPRVQGCEFIGEESIQLGANGSKTVEMRWDHQGSVGDFEVCAFLDYPLPDRNDNDRGCEDTFVVVGGTGLGGVRVVG